MTRAICPACRAPISLDAALCARCGLAVRPTCANCGEALGVGDRACARCGDAVDAGPVAAAPRRPARREYADSTVVEAEVVEPGGRTPSRVPRRRFVVQLLVIATVAGVLVAGGLLALELFAPRPAAPFDLVHRSVPAYGFSVSRPLKWTESFRRVGGNQAVVFGDPNGARGFQVVVQKTALSRARSTVADEIRKPPSGTDPISMDNVVVDGHSALRYALIKDGQYRQQWFVERPGGVFRLDFWGPEWNQRETEELAGHIIDTFAVG